MLTETELRKLKPRERIYRVADANGLCIEVTPSGSKFWRYRYRANGVAKMIAVGDGYPETSLARARELRDEQRRILRRGTDPSSHRKSQKLAQADASENTFTHVAREWIERKHGKGGKTIAKVTLAKNKWLLETYAIPVIGHRPRHHRRCRDARRDCGADPAQ